LLLGFIDSAVNTTAANEYLALQGLVPNVPLQITDWAPPNNVSVCVDHPMDACGEGQLDVEAQQAFAPQAVTFFAPTEAGLVSYVAEAARSAGSTEAEIQQITEDFINHADQEFFGFSVAAGGRSVRQEGSRVVLQGLCQQRDQLRGGCSGCLAELVFRLYDGSGEYEVFEDSLKNLTLSGITVRV
jgi:hypothetical protein